MHTLVSALGYLAGVGSLTITYGFRDLGSGYQAGWS